MTIGNLGHFELDLFLDFELLANNTRPRVSLEVRSSSAHVA